MSHTSFPRESLSFFIFLFPRVPRHFSSSLVALHAPAFFFGKGFALGWDLLCFQCALGSLLVKCPLTWFACFCFVRCGCLCMFLASPAWIWALSIFCLFVCFVSPSGCNTVALLRYAARCSAMLYCTGVVFLFDASFLD